MRRNLFVIPLSVAIVTSALPAFGQGATGPPGPSARLNAALAVDEMPEGGLDEPPQGVDPQSWVLPEWMGYSDYNPIPGVDWNDAALQAPKPIRAALILGDFQDRPFVVTQEPGSDHFCLPVDVENNIFNPARGPVPLQDPEKYPEQCNPFTDVAVDNEDVADFYADFYFNEPSDVNYFHTGNEYWLENSWGLIGVDSEGFGPYTMDGKEHEYGITDQGGTCPTGDDCSKDLDTELAQASLVDVTAAIALNGGEDYDFRYLLHAGYDESGTWQQFGEIKFELPENVTDTFGPPDAAERPDDENSVSTRYIPWTSFAAGEGIWSHAIPGALSVQGESDGGAVFAHELSHIFGVLDNYNNPFQPGRSYTGLWANLSRGSFGGPGGHHNRWQIPPTLGASMGSHHMLRNKIRLGFFANRPNELMTVEADTLAANGPQFGTIFPRAYPLFPTTQDQGLHGVQVLMERDQSSCDSSDVQCDRGGYNAYTMEFVDRIGFDSYTPDHGILIAKNKNATDLAPFMWLIDSHPEDLNGVTPPAPFQDRDIVDFIRPQSGERVPIVEGDARQLADGLFHAGTSEGVVSEHVDEANNLHFYVLDFERDERGVASYRVAVRSTQGGGPFPRGVTAEPTGSHSAEPGKVGVVTCDVTNTGTGAADLIRLSVDAPIGWDVTFPYEVLEIAAGATTEVPVHFTVPADAAMGEQTITLTATSETDSAASTTCDSQASVAAASAPVVLNPEPETAPTPESAPNGPTPATGGGLIAGALLAAGAAFGLRRR
ncbi:MAG: M6 family metalloprotease-like protein [Glaciecola sp.]|jgi:M6 family metalloprotease-like protein